MWMSISGGAATLMRTPKTDTIGPLELGKRSIRKAYLQDDMLMYAAALAFRMFFAVIPFLIFVVALLGVLQVPGFFEWLLVKAQSILSKDAVGQVKLVLGQVQHQARGGLLAFGAVAVAVWYASVAVRSLMTALNVVFEVQENRPPQIRYPLSMLLAIGFSFTIAIASALMLVGKPVIGTFFARLGFGEALASVWEWLRWPAAVLLLMVAAAGLHYYVLNFANYSVMYGALGAVLMLLLYFYVSVAVLLLGAEVNAVIRDASRSGGGEVR